jgi:hypothetical protein
MPPDDGVRADEDQMLTRVPAEGTDYNPKELVAGAESGPPLGGPRQDGELLAQEQVLGDKVRAAA